MNIAVIDKGEKTQSSALLKTHQKTLIRLNSAAVARFLQGTEKRKGFFPCRVRSTKRKILAPNLPKKIHGLVEKKTQYCTF